MEYITNGEKIFVEGNIYKDSLGTREFDIGANYNGRGMTMGGRLSSFNGSFSNEKIVIGNVKFGANVDAIIGDIKDAYELLKSKINNIDKTDIYEISRIILETVDEYFNGFANIDKRDNYYKDDDVKTEDNKISDLKGAGVAMCVERAALAQNLLQCLGIKSFYKASAIINNDKPDMHSFNLIENDGKYYIFDTSIPNLINKQINPLIAEIDKETFELLSYPIPDRYKGISTTVSHYNPYRDIFTTITYDAGREKAIEYEPLTNTNSKSL